MPSRNLRPVLLQVAHLHLQWYYRQHRSTTHITLDRQNVSHSSLRSEPNGATFRTMEPGEDRGALIQRDMDRHRHAFEADLGRIALCHAYDGDERAFDADAPEYLALARFAEAAGLAEKAVREAVRVYLGKTAPPPLFS